MPESPFPANHCLSQGPEDQPDTRKSMCILELGHDGLHDNGATCGGTWGTRLNGDRP